MRGQRVFPTRYEPYGSILTIETAFSRFDFSPGPAQTNSSKPYKPGVVAHLQYSRGLSRCLNSCGRRVRESQDISDPWSEALPLHRLLCSSLRKSNYIVVSFSLLPRIYLEGRPARFLGLVRHPREQSQELQR